jgi:DNA-binding NtrC family response regulator
MAKILIVEDQPAVATALRVLFELGGLSCLVREEPESALAALGEEPIGVVVQDMNFSPDATSGREGVELFRRIRERHPRVPIVLLTAWTSLEAAVQMVKEGATDYRAKPWDDDDLLATVRDLLATRERQLAESPRHGGIPKARDELARRHDLRGVVYASQAFHDVVCLALQVAPSDVPVLITGPSGVGKEKVAEIIQASSTRRDGPFVRVNAGALPEELVESELFGAEPGAYTGATRRVGHFEMAHGGTLFLDEIGNLGARGQAKLLRALQSGEFQRLGSSETRKADVRLLCATNTDLEKAMAQGRFREDLYFRLDVVGVRIPPLCERAADVLPLARHFLARASRHPDGGGRWELSGGAEKALVEHSWPGNVRELENAIQRAVLTSGSARIEEEALRLRHGASEEPRPEEDGGELTADEAAEKRSIQEALRRSEGVVSRAASRLGMSRQTLYRRLDKYGLRLERRLEESGDP